MVTKQHDLVTLDSQECLQVFVALELGIVVRFVPIWVLVQASDVVSFKRVVFDDAQVSDSELTDLVKLVVDALVQPVCPALKDIF